ncbi:nuclear transport factor 2 family protein [Phyllobacterium sp. 22229]|uniref:nuclear transport factor 2 family protein n=1 Tax=Phyllobacterium sp. 22229 TaxID=3453895 RepID=UPI003F854E17
MPFNPVETTRLYHSAINALDFEAIAGLFATDAVYASSGIGEIAGRQAILEAFKAYFAVYPDQVAEDDLIEQLSPRSAKSVWRLVATHNGTGEVSRRSGEEVILFDEAGKILRVTVQDRDASRDVTESTAADRVEGGHQTA